MSDPARFSASELRDAAAGQWFGGMPDAPLAVSTDTRIDNRGRIFFALRGEKFDAHDFLDKAVASGCGALCIDRRRLADAPAGIPLLAVEDTLRALQGCALGCLRG